MYVRSITIVWCIMYKEWNLVDWSKNLPNGKKSSNVPKQLYFPK